MAAADFWFVNSDLIFFAECFYLHLFAQPEHGAGNASAQAQMGALIGCKNIRHRAGLAQRDEPGGGFAIALNKPAFFSLMSAKVITIIIFTFLAVRSFHSI